MFETFAMLKQGGWVMLPLGLCSIVALAIIIERAFALRRAHVLKAGLLRLAEAVSGRESVGPFLDIVRNTPGPLARILEEAVATRDLEYLQAFERVNAAGRMQMLRLERGLTLLEIVAGVSPLLGLLGTVLGMVTVFGVITQEGLGDPHVLSDGIAKALITTVAGLSVAIPSLACHSLFSKRVDDLAMEMQNHATTLLLRLHSGRSNGGQTRLNGE